MSGPRILIFSIYYAPEPTGIALNSTWLAGSLADAGWEVSVVAGVPHYPSWRRQPPPWPDGGRVAVRRRNHHVPRRQSALRRGLYELTWLASSLRELPARRDLDLVLGVVPNLGGAALAAAAAARYRAPCAILFQDLVGRAAAQSRLRGGGGVAALARAVELDLARRAAAVAVVAEGFRPYLLEGGVDPARLHRVRNPARLGSAAEPRERARERLGWGDDFVCLHSGNMGYKQGLENVVRAAALARDVPGLRFVLQGDGNQREALEQVARSLGLSNLDFLPLAAAEDFPSVLRAADVLLLNQRRSVRNMSLPAKLGTYFAAGLPVVAAVDAADETAGELAAAGAGLLVEAERAELLLEAVLRLRAEPELAARLGAAGRTYAERHLSEEGALRGITAFLEAARARAPRPDPAIVPEVVQ